ncbi:MAG: hypothetical protein HGA85_06745 [Nanoarchaeota archaeon]|nr:hypothetical protein [Nanoarchaeota archaeon]
MYVTGVTLDSCPCDLELAMNSYGSVAFSAGNFDFVRNEMDKYHVFIKDTSICLTGRSEWTYQSLFGLKPDAVDRWRGKVCLETGPGFGGMLERLIAVQKGSGIRPIAIDLYDPGELLTVLSSLQYFRKSMTIWTGQLKTYMHADHINRRLSLFSNPELVDFRVGDVTKLIKGIGDASVDIRIDLIGAEYYASKDPRKKAVIENEFRRIMKPGGISLVDS